MIKKSFFFNIYEMEGKRVFLTKSLVPGKQVYGEKIVNEKGTEYRVWDPTSSKIAAGLMMGIKQLNLKEGDAALYLGASSGTTVSHVSDIVGEKGIVFAIDNAPRMMRELIFLAEDRPNIAPILADAGQPGLYAGRICEVDWLFQDVAQRNQVEIFLKNVKWFLKPGGFACLALKARSVDVSKKPKEIFIKARKEIEKEMIIVDAKELGQLEKDHMFFVCKKK